MTTETTAPPPAANPPDKTMTRLRARVYELVAESVAKVGCAPGTVSANQDSTGRHASMYFDGIDDAARWADWLHWPYATSNRDGNIVLTAYGQWLGFSWQIVASEPLAPVAAPAHREG